MPFVEPLQANEELEGSTKDGLGQLAIAFTLAVWLAGGDIDDVNHALDSTYSTAIGVSRLHE